jgi:hypothetical protein
VQISLNGESAPKPEAKADAWKLAGTSAIIPTANGASWRAAAETASRLRVLCRHCDAGTRRRTAGRGRTCGSNPDRSPATGSATASREPNANKRSRTQRKSLNFQGSSGGGPRSGLSMISRRPTEGWRPRAERGEAGDEVRRLWRDGAAGASSRRTVGTKE